MPTDQWVRIEQRRRASTWRVFSTTLLGERLVATPTAKTMAETMRHAIGVPCQPGTTSASVPCQPGAASARVPAIFGG
ncbi:hypothetical protein, partial [Brevibacterium sandarakinum]|uniref:hypothetical protein n=1 Tax=Brevibacterium sandarakinum TaxID=629680 RepID=UPI0026567B76